MTMPNAAPELDLSPFFQAWTQNAGRMVDFEEPVENALPLPPAAEGEVALRASDASCELRFGSTDIPILAGCLNFEEDDAIRKRMGAAATKEDIDIIAAALRDSIPAGGDFILSPVSDEPGPSSKVGFEVAGFDASNIYLVSLSGDGLAGDAATMALPAAPLPEVDDSATHAHEAAMPSFSDQHATVAPDQGRASRMTALVVDTEDERGRELVTLLKGEGWRILDQKAPRSILNWALTERVVDVIVLDGDWPHAALLRQNLGSDTVTSTLPVLAPGPPARELLVAMTAAAAEKRKSD